MALLLFKRFLSAKPVNPTSIIKSLRSATSAPIAEVKSALEQTEWDVERAKKLLRQKGLAAASKKSSRRAAEGLVAVSSTPTAAAVVELNCETDFVARNDQFKTLISHLSSQALSSKVPNSSDVSGAIEPSTLGLDSQVTELASIVRENLRFRRAFRVEGDTVGTYIHGALGGSPTIGRIAAVVALKSLPLCTEDNLKELASKLAMHVVGAMPRFLDRNSIPDDVLEEEKHLLTKQAVESGKPEAIIQKIVTGRLEKFYEDTCLLDQKYIVDNDVRVRSLLPKGVSIASFYRVQVGEGLEEEQGI